VWVAVAGAELDVTLSGAGGESIAVPPVHPVWVPAGSTIVCGGARRGCRAILAVSGGIDVPVILGGRGTDARSAFGGFDGQPLRAGDRLALGPGRLPPPLEPARAKIVPRTVGEEFKPWHAGPVRVIRGPEFDAFDGASQEAFLTAAFVVTGDSDRMGCRLAGPGLRAATTIRSQPVVPGTIQVPPSGQPILLLADAPTTGGYPRIAVVATVDLPCVAQTRPGDRLHFEEISIHEATARLCDRERALARLGCGLEAGR
jgi:antagonist of KipI